MDVVFTTLSVIDPDRDDVVLSRNNNVSISLTCTFIASSFVYGPMHSMMIPTIVKYRYVNPIKLFMGQR